MDYWIVYIIILITGLAIGIIALVALHRYGPGRKLSKSLLENITLSLLTIFITLMGVELFFAFFAQTDNLNFTLASKNWFQRYWVVNSLGYRDIEWTPEKLQGKRKITVLGDSFTAGYGIKNVEDRFANILGKRLGEDYAVMVVAENGTETNGEIKRIKAYPYKPDILILQYYINDIEDAAHAKDVRFTPPKLYPPPLIRPLIQNSYSLNFFYWRTIRFGPYSWADSYLPWIKSVYNDPNIWWLYQQELLTIYEGTLSEKIKLIVVVFPALTDVKGTREITDKVVDFFEQRGVPTLDVAEWVENTPPQDLVVSQLDSHPNEGVHHLVADRLYEQILHLEVSHQK